jgi:hypothetical protein
VVFAFIAIISSFVLCVIVCGDYAGCGFLNLLERGGLPVGEIIPGPPILYYSVFFLLFFPFFVSFSSASASPALVAYISNRCVRHKYAIIAF